MVFRSWRHRFRWRMPSPPSRFEASLISALNQILIRGLYSCPQLAEADMGALSNRAGFDPIRSRDEKTRCGAAGGAPRVGRGGPWGPFALGGPSINRTSPRTCWPTAAACVRYHGAGSNPVPHAAINAGCDRHYADDDRSRSQAEFATVTRTSHGFEPPQVRTRWPPGRTGSARTGELSS